jgi:hypothetical protein
MLLDKEYYKESPHEVSSSIWMGRVDLDFIRKEIPGFYFHTKE